MKKIYCNNCGEENHFQRNCKYPITSYGLLCFFYKNNYKNIKYLMIQKRNSFSFIEFIQAKYYLQNPEYIQKLFDNMTYKEKMLIHHNKFNKLWNDLWLINVKEKNKNFKKSDFYKGILKFNILKNGYICQSNSKFHSIEKFIQKSKTSYEFPEWYFPKGRKNFRETNIETSLREFGEETNLDIKDIKIIKELGVIEEIHMGINKIQYKTIFYPTFYEKDNIINYDYTHNLNKRNKYQKQEVGDIKWLTYEEVLTKFRDYEIEKKNIFIQSHEKIINYLQKRHFKNTNNRI
jgi:8-oxo-dGTP pyrophosphatase MutT (NUDIX family)